MMENIPIHQIRRAEPDERRTKGSMAELESQRSFPRWSMFQTLMAFILMAFLRKDAAKDDTPNAKSYLLGYPSYSAYIARDTDDEADVYRVFRRLSARTLLHRQSELISLENKLMEMEDQDAVGHKDVIDKDLHRAVEIQGLANRWPFIDFNPESEERDSQGSHSKSGGLVGLGTIDQQITSEPDDVERALNKKEITSAQAARVRLAREVDQKLREYHKFLLLEAEVLKLHRPSERVLSTLVKELERHTLHPPGGSFLENRRDLVVLKDPPGQDMLSGILRKVARHFGPLYKKHYPHDDSQPKGSATVYISNRRLENTTSVMGGFLAIGILNAAIWGLRYAQTEKLRLGLITLFTAVFAFMLKFVSTASRSELFGASAAFAAILVVFVNGPLDSGSVGSNGISNGTSTG